MHPYVPARYAYHGSSSIKATQWLETNEIELKGFRWLNRAVAHPIGKYDVSFNDDDTGPISDNTPYSQVMHQRRWKDTTPLKNFKTIICFGSQLYLEKVKNSFRSTDAQVLDGYTLEEFRRFLRS